MNSTTIAVDVAKSVFEVAVSEYPGQVRERHRLSRGRFSRFLAEHPPATVVMEACGSAHHWAREAQSRGHRVVLVPPYRVNNWGRPENTGVNTDGRTVREFRGRTRDPKFLRRFLENFVASCHEIPCGGPSAAIRIYARICWPLPVIHR